MKTMKAMRIHEYGGPEVMQYVDVPVPELASGEVLVRVHAAGVNPIDWKIRQGLRTKVSFLPMILGWDVSGVITATGPGAVRLKVGDEVFSRPDIGRNGAYAEYIAIRESEVALKPKSIDHINAAAIPLASLTAWQAMFDAAGLSAGQKILIHAAAGGVGSFAVQLAKSKGAYVIGTASGRNQEFLRNLGADETIDYGKTRFEEVVHDVDVVLDTMGEETRARSWKVLKKGGILSSVFVPPPTDEEAAAHGVRQVFTFVQPKLVELEEIANLVDSGKVRVEVEKVLPLTEARQAHQMVQAGHTRGKIVLRVV